MAEAVLMEVVYAALGSQDWNVNQVKQSHFHIFPSVYFMKYISVYASIYMNYIHS